MNLGTEPPSLDWHVTTDSTSFDVICNLMVGLTQYKDDLSVAPACAKSWEVKENGKVYIFHLRDDVYWSDGKRLTSYDFLYAWQRLLTPSTASQYAFFLHNIEGAYEYNTGQNLDPACVQISAPDQFTFQVRLKKPAAYFIYLTAFCPSYPARKDIIEKYGNNWTNPEHIVTNGPFLLKHWQHEYKIELFANPNYFEGEASLKKIKMFMIPEASSAFALYENNQLDYIDNRSFPTPDIERYQKSSEYHNIPLLRNNYIGFNCEKAPFNNKIVRQAVSMAIDRNAFARVLKRNEKASYNWIPEGLLGYNKNSGIEYNPEKARLLLKQAGFDKGKDFPKVNLLYANREDTRLVVETIQDQLKRNLNIQVELTNQEYKVYLQTLKNNTPPMFRNSWGADYPDPETFMNIFTSFNGNNRTHWKNTHYDELIYMAQAEQDLKRRGELYATADRLLCKEEATIASTYLSTQNLLVKPWVKGMAFNSLDLQFFKDIKIDNSWDNKSK
jgi:oligopeptide transport system substrate-binding protein